MPLQRALQVSIEMWALKLRISFSRRRNGWKEVKRDEGSRLQLYSLPHWWSQDILKLYLETSSILFSGMMFAKEGTLNSLLKGVNLSSAQNNPTVIAESCLLTTHCCVQFPNRVSECPIPSPTSVTTIPHACLSKICKVTENCFQIVECECKIKSTLHRSVWVKCKAKNLPSHKRLFKKPLHDCQSCNLQQLSSSPIQKGKAGCWRTSFGTELKASIVPVWTLFCKPDANLNVLWVK